MAGTSLDRWQRKALSEHAGAVILEYYHDQPPLWAKVGTETQATLRGLLVQRLKDNDCGDVALYLAERPQDTTRAIQQRFKSLREKERRDGKKRAAGTSPMQPSIVLCLKETRKPHRLPRQDRICRPRLTADFQFNKDL